MSGSIFLLGATGYIGGSVLLGLKQTYPSYEFTAIVRSEKNIPAVEALGVRVVKGTNQDHDLIITEASKASIIVNCADADDLELVKAIITGAKKTSLKQTPIYIHTSGTGLVTDEPKGVWVEGLRVWNDNEPQDIREIPDEAPHRNVDLEIFNADEQGYVSAYIIAPSTIYGTGFGPVNKISQQVPGLIKAALKHKQPVYVGEGTNKWNNVHIQDLVVLYQLVANLATSELVPAAKVDSYTKFFWGSVGTHTWGDLVKEIGKIMYEKGLVTTADPKSVDIESVKQTDPNLFYTANNSLTVADRSFKIGWVPKSPGLNDTLDETISLVALSSGSA